ncbi:MAG: diaminopimelate epimerase [Gammaproteobacteria bacterium]|nr:diaminopimelate epimerase [Gammaproteobacteria bacterium]
MQVSYFKMHGAGNKILVVDRRQKKLPTPAPAKLRELGDEATGPGFDQLMWVSAPENAVHKASYRVFNADGSEVEQCGNGVRCVARVLARELQLPCSFTLESPAGPVSAKVGDDGLVSVSMGSPEFDPVRIPFLAEARGPHYLLDVDGQSLEILAVSMGNPHCVLRVPDVETARVEELGPKIERHDRFPERTNVGFMSISDRANIDLRVHERGVGETLACGTGACAAVVSGQQMGLLDAEVNVRLPGGQVVVSWRGGTEPVWLTGKAELISQGTMDL